MQNLPLMLLALAASVPHGEATAFRLEPPSHVMLAGSSNLRRWRCRTDSLDVQLDVDASLERINEAIDAFARDRATPAALPPVRFVLRVPIGRFACGNALIERDMARALNAAQHPFIEFRLTGTEGPVTYEEAGGRHTGMVIGELSIAGVRRRAAIPLQAWRVDSDTFYFRAVVPLRMSDFSVKPPTALFGLIRARDEVTVYFDMRLGAAAAAESTKAPAESDR